MTKSLPNESATLLPRQDTKVSFPWTVEIRTTDTYRVGGVRYYAAEPHVLPKTPLFRYQSTNILWQDMHSWCTEQFGSTPDDGIWTPGARWYCNNTRFWFCSEADLTWFVLRWS